MEPRLRRSRNEVIIAGVCGGLAEYFGVDPVIVRLIFVLVTLTTGIGVLLYPVLWLVMPKAELPVRSTPPFPQGGVGWSQPERTLGQEPAPAEHEVLLREQPQAARSRPAAAPF